MADPGRHVRWRRLVGRRRPAWSSRVTTSPGSPSSSGVATPIRAAARSPTSTMPAGWPSSSGSTITSSTSATTSTATWSRRTSTTIGRGPDPEPVCRVQPPHQVRQAAPPGRRPRLRAHRHRPPRRIVQRRRRRPPPRPRRRCGQGPVLRVAHARPGRSWPGCCFPVGDLTKDEVRALATELGLRTADKPDSQDVCFIHSDRRSPDLPRRSHPAAPGQAGRRRRPRGRPGRLDRAGHPRPAQGPRPRRRRPSVATPSTSITPRPP